MLFTVSMLSNKLWYVQHATTKRFYFERYTQESDARLAAASLEELDESRQRKSLLVDFVPKTTYCSTVHGHVNEPVRELSITNDSEGFWLIEHEETHMFLIYKYADPDKAQQVADNMMSHWSNDPKAKANALQQGYFMYDRSAIREHTRF